MGTSAILFIHPACSCENTIDLVKDIAKEHPDFQLREVSLVTPEGRKEASSAEVKTIPTLVFEDGTKFVTSVEITRENVVQKINHD